MKKKWKKKCPRIKYHLRSRNCFRIMNEVRSDNHEYRELLIAKKRAWLNTEREKEQ